MLKKNKNYLDLINCLEKLYFEISNNLEDNTSYHCNIMINKKEDIEKFLDFISEYFIKYNFAIHILALNTDEEIISSPYYILKVLKEDDDLYFTLKNSWKHENKYDICIEKLKDFKINTY